MVHFDRVDMSPVYQKALQTSFDLTGRFSTRILPQKSYLSLI